MGVHVQCTSSSWKGLKVNYMNIHSCITGRKKYNYLFKQKQKNKKIKIKLNQSYVSKIEHRMSKVA